MEREMRQQQGPTSTQPLVSVVTVCFNPGPRIAEAIASVLGQTYPNIEYWVIDGGSTDGTLAMLRSFELESGGRLQWTSEPDSGIYDAMNKGIGRCSGELIGLLNADDAYLPNAVERVVSAYLADPGTGAVYGDAEVVDSSGNVRAQQVCSQAEKLPLHMPMCHQSLFVSRATYEAIGTYDTGYRILADYDWVLRARAKNVRMTYVPAALVRFSAGGVSSTDMKRSNRERERIRVAYGANPVVERVRRIRHTVNLAVYGSLQRVLPSRKAR
jgi:glycosyltransferase involved in cell wall biosynthesis